MVKFKKGQTVYQACTHFAENATSVEYRVVSRVVDACGKKQVTFEDHGHDSVFRRRLLLDAGPKVFATADEAFSYLAQAPSDLRKTPVINPDVVSDATWVPSIL